MANADFNGARVIAGFALVAESVDNTLQLEKISCSDGQKLVPLQLMGRHVRVGETTFSDYGDGNIPESIIYEAMVVGVQFGSCEHGVPSVLLLREDGFDYPNVVHFSNVTVLGVLQ